jgi:hypothetical protein
MTLVVIIPISTPACGFHLSRFAFVVHVASFKGHYLLSMRPPSAFAGPVMACVVYI